MRVAHLVYAHPDPHSYNAALKTIAEEMLEAADFEIYISDLYAEHEMLNRFYGETLTAEQKQYIKAEQEKIKAARLTIVQFPLYWFSFPAILKNYFDLVYAKGFAYPGIYADSPLYDGRQVLFSITTQASAADFSNNGRNGDIGKTLFPMELAYCFVGYKILPALLHYGVPTWSEAELTQGLQRYTEQLEEVIYNACN